MDVHALIDAFMGIVLLLVGYVVNTIRNDIDTMQKSLQEAREDVAEIKGALRIQGIIPPIS